MATRKKSSSRRYSKKASNKVGRAMHEAKRGTLRSGRSGKKVKSRKQAIAIGLSEAREEGAKVPSRKTGSSSRKKSSSRKRSTGGRKKAPGGRKQSSRGGSRTGARSKASSGRTRRRGSANRRAPKT